VVLHALATAILAACGLGDLGQMFPASDPGSEGVASAVLLAAVVTRAASVGWRVTRAQVAILGARPHLGGQRLDEMRLRIAELLGLPAEQVAATASSGNLSGPEGAGRVISATAVIGVHRR
jgi:2-C-methyl-D-erythritol 2,4-cyclodiphosphate synthase